MTFVISRTNQKRWRQFNRTRFTLSGTCVCYCYMLLPCMHSCHLYSGLSREPCHPPFLEHPQMIHLQGDCQRLWCVSHSGYRAHLVPSLPLTRLQSGFKSQMHWNQVLVRFVFMFLLVSLFPCEPMQQKKKILTMELSRQFKSNNVSRNST